MKNVLFVDDETRVLDGLRRMLRSKREVWECRYATSAAAALAQISTGEFDAVVSDVNMPGGSGLDLLRSIRGDERTRYLPVLMLTGNGEVGTKRAALDLGATDFLNKPFDFIELTARLQNAIAMKGFQDEIRNQNALLEQRIAARTMELERSRRDIILRLAKAAETRDSHTGNHIVRVGVVSKLLAQALGFDEKGQEDLLLTAPLHDVGKIGISDDILQKPGPLTGEERRRMQEHCRIGKEILTEELSPVLTRLAAIDAGERANKFLDLAAKVAFSHHERWDGTGYPIGLKGEEIPIEARIVAVADVYDALRSKRPYKGDVGSEETLRIIAEGSGTQFDPKVVAVFVANFASIENATEGLRDQDFQEPARLAA